MPKHLAIGYNYQSGTVSFTQDKSMNVLFVKPFPAAPNIDISVDDNSLSVPYRINISNLGFTIKFQIKFTGNVEWKAIEK